MRILLASLAFVFLFASCGSKQIHPDNTGAMTPNKLLDIQVHWLKDKKKKYDMEMTLRNTSKNDLIVLLNDIQCYRGEAMGQVKHTFFNTGERTIDLRKGQLKQFRLVCDSGIPATGDAKIVVAQVYDNPQGDGATKGKVLSSAPIKWTGSFTEKK